MSDLPYYYGGESGSRKYLESLVPLLILVLIAVVLVGKTTNVFCTVPGLNNALCNTNNKLIQIAVIGTLTPTPGSDGATLVNASELKDYFTKKGMVCNMQPTEFSPNTLSVAKTALLKHYDLLILTGDRRYTLPVRNAVEDYLKSGGKVVIIGDAATLDSEDAMIYGWGSLSSPVKLVDSSYSDSLTDSAGIPYVNLNNSILELTDPDNPINVGYKLFSNFNSTNTSCKNGMKVIEVVPVNGNIIDVLSGIDERNNKKRDFPAIVEQKGIMGGTVYYFSYDPGCSPDLWSYAVEEITGKKTC